MGHPRVRQSLIRLPAEWEPQDAVLLAWPHDATAWAPYLDEARATMAAIGSAITRFERILVAAVDARAEVTERLAAAGADLRRVSIYSVPFNDTWTRDYGPITVVRSNALELRDFVFNGWGLKFAAADDNQVTRRLHEAGAFGSTRRRLMPLVLEGGAIESDGAGTILTTSTCQLSPNRNPGMSRRGIEEAFENMLGAQRVLWLDHGHIDGDDTDGHIDTLARFCPDDTIAYVRCDDRDDPHFKDLAAMEAEIRRLETRAGRGYRLVPLPWPKPVFYDGVRLPATYANFLVVNGGVLVPTYGQPDQDAAALAAIGQAFPGRQIVGIDCRVLLRQHGSLHCVTMQIPKGVLG